MKNYELGIMNENSELNGFAYREGVIINHTAGYSDKM